MELEMIEMSKNVLQSLSVPQNLNASESFGLLVKPNHNKLIFFFFFRQNKPPGQTLGRIVVF